MAVEEITSDTSNMLSEWPPGPLDLYRKKASFDWKKMRMLIEGEDVTAFKAKVWRTLEREPLFFHNSWEELTRSEERRLTFARMKRLLEIKFVNEEDYLTNPYLIPAFVQTIGAYNWSLIVKRVLSQEYFVTNAMTNTSDSENLVDDIKNFRAFGCISITEMAHGSNTKDLKTTATFDAKTQEFVLNTPSLEATKVWSGVLGQTATHAVVFAQLYTPDNKCHGLHSFMVKVRDPKTQKPFAGITIGDMGPKIGLNGLDNGFMHFNNYRIPKGSLMNSHADITSDGKYVPRVTASEKTGATLGILSAGRVFITHMSITNLQMAIVIAVRYSATRRQFGPSTEEWPIIEYQTQQWRLFPYVAASYVLNNFFFSLYQDYVDFFVTSFNPVYGNKGEMGAEIHSLSSCAKAVCGWMARDAIQESREACGGHGYLKAARLGELRNDHDANNTYEGDNNVLLQQTSNYLMKLFKEKIDNQKTVNSPFSSVNYIDDYENILKTKFDGDVHNLNSLIKAYRFIVCWLLKQSDTKMNVLLKKYNGDIFRARNECQAYYLRSLAIAFFECNVIERFHTFCSEQSIPENMRTVLNKMGLLFALWTIEKHLLILYESNYIAVEVSNNMTTSVRETILSLCSQLKDEAVALVDVLSPPDFILNSCIAHSDGRIYEHIFDALSHNKGAFQQPDWFTEFTEKKPQILTSDSQLKAKL
ncbi:Peroxisomal acyl-coenzyme A oxidase 3-like protein [Leptotrombidium deliense]|uniref:Acyl-coenzyme A oxidase n=1 Tax=Leptotrombidium deliense TaxID=299467 RepID=A0A443S9G0_9ACAR|nr:Peroxisomal acyl-coenzyme A oxidase 3-like protein [Leptotrombidium deliense]